MQNKPIIYQPGVVPQEIYSGVPSFMGLPVAKTAEDVKNFDFAVMGVPWEGGCTYGGFSSCVVAPKTFRGVSTRYTGYLPDYDIDTFDYMTACDYGDTVVQNGNYDLTFANMREKFGEIIDAGAIPITFGGDHSISYPMISEMAKRHKKRVGVIHFDAHLDTMPSFGDDLYSRCSPFNRLPRSYISESEDREIIRRKEEKQKNTELLSFRLWKSRRTDTKLLLKKH